MSVTVLLGRQTHRSGELHRALDEWANAHRDDIRAARERHDEN